MSNKSLSCVILGVGVLVAYVIMAAIDADNRFKSKNVAIGNREDSLELKKIRNDLKNTIVVMNDEQEQLRTHVSNLEAEIANLNTALLEYRTKNINPYLRKIHLLATQIEERLPEKIAQDQAVTKDELTGYEKRIRSDIAKNYRDLFSRIKKHHPAEIIPLHVELP